MMGHNIHSGSGDAAMMQQMHVKMETVDENATAFVLGSHESSAPCEESAYCTYTAAGEACPSPTDNLDLADTQHAATGSTILLYPVSTERYFPAPATEKTFSHSSDFCSKAVMYLIEGVGRRWGLYETRERSQLFQSVQDEMAANGYVLPVEKIRRKWNNLIVTYKRVKDRNRETGHAKTSWEFFDLMDATLCDTVGAQVHSSKSKTTSKAISTGSVPLLKIAAKPHVSEHCAPVISPYGDFTTPAVAGAHINSEISSAVSVATVPVSLETTAPELKPLILLNGDITTASVQPAALSLCPSLVSSAYATETLPPAPSHSFELTNSNAHPRVKIRSSARLKAPLLRPGTAGRRGGGQEGRAPPQPSQRNNHNNHALSSSLPSTFSSHSPFPTSSYDPSRTDGQPQTDAAELGGSTSSLLQEVLRRQEEQACQDQAAGRRADARERRRERREVRMAESLGRIATALELLSSKQDTVIALLQRLAERK